uniref:PHD-type domain-containing protein n=4 Tax=Oreochromis TaxID=8139 RepID=A0A669CZJ1_ORENI
MHYQKRTMEVIHKPKNIDVEGDGGTSGEKTSSLDEGNTGDETLEMYPPAKAGNEPLSLLKQDVLEDSDDNGIVQNISPELKQPQTGVSPSQSSTSLEKDWSRNSSNKSDSSNAEEEFYKCALPQQPCFFFIDHKDWEDLKKTQKGRLFKGMEWTNVVATGIKSIHPFCSFGFKRHTINTTQSRSKTAVFSCTAYCRFKDCPVTVKVEVKDEKTLKADVLFQGGEVCHNTKEIKTRPVRGQSRDVIAEKLETKLPRSLYLDSLNQIPEKAFQAGCRDEAPSKDVLKNIAWSHRKKQRPHVNEMASLQMLIDRQQGLPNEVLQRVLLHPKGIMLWSKKTLSVFYQRCKDDIVYFDATGSIISKDNASATPYYVYEVIVRNPFKGSSPLPTATFVTCDHTTASVTYFLQAFQTELTRMYGSRANKRPVMIICDGSMVLLQSIAMTFCRASLEDLLERYFQVITGQLDTDNFNIPILHRCLSHIMKNAKDLCKKRLQKHYKFGMHVFGLLACSSNLKDMDGIIISATVVFKSPCSGPQVKKHLRNLKMLIDQTGNGDAEDTDIIPEDYKTAIVHSSLKQHFAEVIASAPLDVTGPPNVYHAPAFISSISKYFLPHATLWSGMLLGDLGRHGKGSAYGFLSKRYNHVSQLKKQNYTEDNRTQGIMEKSQWDLKRIRFERRRLTRLDDFVQIYQRKHDALLREYGDVGKKRMKKYRVETEKWKKKSRKRKGFYVTPLMGKRLKQDHQEEPPHSDVPTEQTEAVTTQDEKEQAATQKRIMSAQLTQDVDISVWIADLCKFQVDAVVNAANTSLQHCGGLALAISESGGPKIQKESNTYIAENGPLRIGEAIVTSAGNLSCKKIIHVVGPCMQSKPSAKDVTQAKPILRQAIISVLQKAEEHKLCSIAIPAVSSGIYNFPARACADVIVQTIYDHVKNKTTKSAPFTINLVDKEEKTAKELERACKELLSDPFPNSVGQGNQNEDPTRTSISQVTALWKRKQTEVVVAVIPSQIKGNNFIVHHSELKSLEPHRWLTGEIIECALHDIACKLDLGSKVYILNHYTAGVILFGKRELMRRHCLSKVNFDNYHAIVSFVNVGNVHWKFLYLSKADSCLYLVDPARSTRELEESKVAAQKFREFFKMRRTAINKTDWVDIKLKGGVLKHPVQKDTNSCGVIVILMAKAFMESFPKIPEMTFKTTIKAMVQQREAIALQILGASVFEAENNCAMCSTPKPPFPGPSITKWIQCDSCSRWFHTQCLQMNTDLFQKAEAAEWECALCEK